MISSFHCCVPLGYNFIHNSIVCHCYQLHEKFLLLNRNQIMSAGCFLNFFWTSSVYKNHLKRTRRIFGIGHGYAIIFEWIFEFLGEFLEEILIFFCMPINFFIVCLQIIRLSQNEDFYYRKFHTRADFGSGKTINISSQLKWRKWINQRFNVGSN